MNVILNRDVEVLGPGTSPDKDTRDRTRAMAEPLTPKSQRLRKAWGSLMVSMQTVGGLCPDGKCVRRMGHAGACYPAGPVSGQE